MQKVIYLSVIAALILFASCSKHAEMPYCDTPFHTGDNTWQWSYAIGGIGGATIKPDSVTQIFLYLHQDSTYLIALDKAIVQQGHYYITSNDSLLHFDADINVVNLHMQKTQKILLYTPESLQLFDDGITDGFKFIFINY